MVCASPFAVSPKNPSPLSSYPSFRPPSISPPPMVASQLSPTVSPSSPFSLHNRQRRMSAHSLAGSYTLSLLSSRMSLAHAPHSLPSAFTLQIGATAMGPAEARLRSPPHARVPFEARWYDLEGGPGGAAVGTPWVGNVDVEGHYTAEREVRSRRGRSPHNMIERGYRERKRSPSSPSPRNIKLERSLSARTPRQVTQSEFAGYELASQGILQLVVKNDTQAFKVFIVKYDLNALDVGGKMLVRERTYEAVKGSPGEGKRREVLRSAVELQFTCVESVKKKKKRYTEPGAHTTPSSSMSSPSGFTPGHGFSPWTTSPDTLPPPVPATTPKRTKKLYFLSKTVRIVFPPLVGNPAKPPKEETRTEQFIEVINPSVEQPGMSPRELKKLRRASFACESWDGVRELLGRRREEDKVDEAEAQIQALPMTFARTSTPVPIGQTSLLTARLGGREPSEPEAETKSLNHWHREIGIDPAASSPVTSPLDKKRSLWPEDESERMLSESLQRLPWRR